MMAIIHIIYCLLSPSITQQQHTAIFVSYSFLKKLLQNVLFLTKNVLSSAIITRKCCTPYLTFFERTKEYILEYKKGVRSRNRWYARAWSAVISTTHARASAVSRWYCTHTTTRWSFHTAHTLDSRHIICCINHITIISTANNNKILHAVQMAFGSRIIDTASPKSGPTCFL